MSINIYPAIITESGSVIHAADWKDEFTLNLANANFHSLAKELNIQALTTVPSHIRVKTLEVAMSMSRSPRYDAKLKDLCAKAKQLKATHIAFS